MTRLHPKRRYSFLNSKPALICRNTFKYAFDYTKVFSSCTRHRHPTASTQYNTNKVEMRAPLCNFYQRLWNKFGRIRVRSYHLRNFNNNFLIIIDIQLGTIYIRGKLRRIRSVSTNNGFTERSIGGPRYPSIYKKIHRIIIFNLK